MGIGLDGRWHRLWFKVCYGLQVVFLALIGGSGAVASSAEPVRPNILVILMDDLGWKDLGCYGNRFIETPHSDRLAREGMRFTEAYAAAPVCSPTRASLLTGQHPARLGMFEVIQLRDRPFARLSSPPLRRELPENVESIAELLGQAGYACASVGKWHVGRTPPAEGFLPIPNEIADSEVRDLAVQSPQKQIGRLTAQTIQFLREHRGRPFLLMLNHHAVHAPLEARADLVAKYDARANALGVTNIHPVYAAMTEMGDESLGRVMAELDRLQLAQRTVVIFTSDNGGLIGDPYLSQPTPLATSNLPLRSQKGDLYEGGLRVPLIVRWPGQVQPGSTCAVPVVTPDLFATVLDLAGVAAPRDQPLDGLSLRPLLREDGPLRREALHWHFPTSMWSRWPGGAIRQGRFKLIEFFEDNHIELYDLATDIGETRDLAGERPELAAQLLDRLRRWRLSVGAPMPQPNPRFDPALADRLPQPPWIQPASGSRAVVDTSRSPGAQLQHVNLTDVHWTAGFWAQWHQRMRDTTLPLLYDLANDPQRGAIQNLEIAAGLKQGPYTGNNWMDAWVYKWIEAAACVYADTEDPALLRQMDELIAIIARAQQPDGYLATQNIVRKRPRFQQPNHHEVYVMGHLLTAAAVHHRMTGKDNLLNVARKTGDFLASRFKDRNPQMAHFPFNPSVIMGAVELYRVTGEPRYLELANTVIDMRGAFPGGTDQTQDRIPLRDEKEVVGHAVFYTYLYAGATDAYLETGDPKLLAALNRLWDDLTQHKLYLTGGTCAQYRGFSIRNGSIYSADDVHEAVGAAYALPNSPAYNETCGQVGNFLWNWRMLAVNGEARFAEMMEREMYNGWLPGIGVQGDSFTYTNPLRWFGEEQELWSQDSLLRHLPADPKRGREAGGDRHGTCCPSNVLRALAELQAAFYSVAGRELWVHQYGGNRFDNGTFGIEQETDYPWDGKVKITIQAAPPSGSLRLRIPDWADGFRVWINDAAQPTDRTHGGYLRLQRNWQAGDVIQLDLPMRVRLMQAHRKVDSTRGQVAVMRGPLVYCLESVDLPQGVDVSEIILPRDAEWVPKWEPSVLGGITTLNGLALRVPRDDSALYTHLGDRVPSPIRIRLIPYYAWKNRGVSAMTVWIPATW